MSSEHLERIRAAEDAGSLRALLRGVDPLVLNGRESDLIARRLLRFPLEESALRVAFLGNHTLDPLAMRTVVHAGTAGIALTPWVAPFGQYMRTVLDRDAGLTEFAPHIVFLSLAMRALAPRLYSCFAGLGAAERAAERERLLAHIDDWVSAGLAATDALLLIANFNRPAEVGLGVADTRQPLGESEFYLELDLELIRRYRGEQRVRILDLDRLALAHGAERAFDDRLYHIAKVLWSEDFTARIAHELVRYVVAERGAARKCLVVDLDNTIWGGVVGEDGPDGIEIGNGTPRGEAFTDMQWALKGLQARGIVLAICSKNNASDVDSAFSAQREMPLGREDFVAERINWEPKPTNLVAIAEELNIGIEALAFVDDNPVERELVRRALPEVAIIDLPPDPAGFADALRKQVIFDRLAVTAEDLAKTGQYAQQARRRRFERHTGDLSEYLAGLETELVVRPARPVDLARVHQLFTKTNQFNLTTRRYTPAEIERFLDDECWDLRIAHLTDRFGDLGVIALYLVQRRGRFAEIDSFVMSCRALGRDAETALMNQMKARLAGTADRIAATFVPTRRNAPAREFLPSQGFSLVTESSDGARRYELETALAVDVPCPHITVTEETA